MQLLVASQWPVESGAAPVSQREATTSRQATRRTEREAQARARRDARRQADAAQIGAARLGRADQANLRATRKHAVTQRAGGGGGGDDNGGGGGGGAPR
jgi:hypothetical protein